MVLANIITKVVGICIASKRKHVVEAASSESLSGPSSESDEGRALASAPGVSWQSFKWQVSASEEPRPTRSVRATGALAVGSRW